MDHSVAAYIARLLKEKAEKLWQEWVIHDQMPPHITPDLLVILKLRLEELNEERKVP